MIKIFEENKKLSYFTTILIAIGIFAISSIPSYEIAGFGKANHLAIIYHFFAFFFLSLFLIISTTKNKNFEFVIPGIIICIIYAILDELHQYFVPGRFCSLGDIATDVVGIILAVIIYYSYKKFQR